MSGDPFKGNTDDLIEQMKRDEAEGATKMSPIDWGKSRGVTPQLVYYWIRSKKITAEHCACGRRVIDVAEADAYLKSRGEKDA